jgi:hypothetical protein
MFTTVNIIFMIVFAVVVVFGVAAKCDDEAAEAERKQAELDFYRKNS